MPHPSSKRAKANKKQRASARRQSSGNDRRDRAERQAASDSHREEVRRQRRRRARTRSATVAALMVLAIGGLGWVLFSALRPGPELAGVERPPYEGRGHVSGASYASASPTSGAHDSRAPSCGSYQTPLDPSLAVHALEHGAVVVWYDASLPALGSDLSRLADEWDSHVIISPSLRLDSPIVATAWHREKAYGEVVPEIDEFIATYRRRGPEKVDCDIV